jgi:hypothetical protein
VLKPRVPQQCIITLLMEVKLSSMAETWINLAEFVNVRCHHPAARVMMQIEDRALPNIDEEADVNLAPKVR